MSDIRALLLTDVVDSTRLTQSLGDAAATRLWIAHDRIARDLLRAWGGREIDKSDGFLFLFPDAARALAYATAYHQAITTLETPIKARAGIDVGPVVLRENEAADVRMGAKPIEVDGIAKSLAARAMSVAGGGQTLLTENAARALAGAPLALHSHGHWRMKGLSDPMELFEAGDAPTRPADAEKAYRVVLRGDLWMPEREVKHGLSAERDAFIGRREELRNLASLFEEGVRLVSILAMGGSGKTRLAARFGWSCLGDFPGGAWFCDLAGARSVDGIVHAVATALDVQVGKDDGVAQIGNAIAGRGKCLVILDNFEQVSKHAPATLGAWLDRASAARFLATTRDVLGLRGEHVMPLSPLPPADGAALFLRRADSAGRAIDASRDEASVLSLVDLLEGVPLAIELAAARARILSPQALLERMSERFNLLASGGERRDRHATLRSTFDWSWDLLSEADKAALAQLSVFEGGFTLEAAEAVLRQSSAGGASWQLEAVQSLVDKSFVRLAPGDRFAMLVSVQEYAAEHLRTEARFEGSGPAALEGARRRHVEHFSALGEKGAILRRGADLDNLIIACRRAIDRRMPEAIGALEGAWAAIRLRGPYRIGMELGLAVRAAVGLEPAAIASIERVLGSALIDLGDSTGAVAHLEEGLEAARACGDERVEARILSLLARAAEVEARNDAARSLHETVLDYALRLRDGTLEWGARQGLSHVALAEGRMDLVESHCRAALQVARASGDRRREGLSLTSLANVYTETGRPEEAMELYLQSLAAAAEMGDRKWEGMTLCNLAQLEQVLGMNLESLRHLELALAMARELGLPGLECVVLCNLGITTDALGQHSAAREHFEHAIALARKLRDRRFEGMFLTHLACVDAHEGRFPEARANLDASESILGEVRDRRSLGMALCARAETEQLAARAGEARVALEQARAIADEVGVGAKSVLGIALAKVVARQEALEGTRPGA